MYTNKLEIRVRYSETDRMGYVYYGHYAQYFEVARVEALRNLGISYRSMEEDGIMLPVASYSIKYLKPAVYDDLLTVETTITTLPSAKIHFKYKTFRGDELLNEAETTLVFVASKNMRPVRCPIALLNKLAPYFE
jgi:acyl-CoA thioester hydrolase